MTETESGPPTQPLTAILAQVKVTSGQAISMLSTLANANADKDPTLYAALNDVIANLQSPSAETKPAEASEEQGLTPTEEPPAV